MKYVAGIDVGTSGVKCIIVAQDGSVAASETRTYPLSNPKENWSEQNPADWWAGTCDAMKTAVEKSGVAPADLVGLSFSGQMHGLVALDKDDKVIRPAILWNDQRTETECEEIIAAAGGLDGLLSYTNNTMLTGYTGGKIVWLKKNEPENYARMTHFLMPKDYIRFLITGEMCTDASEGSGTGLYDVKNRKFSDELIGILGLDKSIFPESVESDEAAGFVTAEAAKLTGLPEGLPVYAGGGDAVIQTTGMGIVKEGTIGFIIGTSGVVSMALDGFGVNTGGKTQYFCNNAKDKWQAFGCQLSSGGSMEWFKNTFYPTESFKTVDADAEGSSPGANGVIFLPYLTGERAPHADPYARAVFYGLSITSSRGDMGRAVMEGVVFGLREIYELIVSTKPDMKPAEVIASGGASKSRIWRQIQADIMGLPVKTLTGAAEGGAYGAAVVAGVGAGLWPSIEHAAEMLAVETVTEPIPENTEKYNEIFKTYSALYQDLKQRFRS